ncbi:MAG: DUF3467 domain-containing protein [Propionibacteriaceae bacterium]|jgi:hypothetical protein|nr:DUF3467 domain-containing protein [Propionibacteriaceae bacterium]
MAEQRLQINMPNEQAIGVYADFVRAWHTNDAFVLDFAALHEPATSTDDGVLIKAGVVSRVRIPPSQVFELMKALEQQLSAWEKETGRNGV